MENNTITIMHNKHGMDFSTIQFDYNSDMTLFLVDNLFSPEKAYVGKYKKTNCTELHSKVIEILDAMEAGSSEVIYSGDCIIRVQSLTDGKIDKDITVHYDKNKQLVDVIADIENTMSTVVPIFSIQGNAKIAYDHNTISIELTVKNTGVEDVLFDADTNNSFEVGLKLHSVDTFFESGQSFSISDYKEFDCEGNCSIKSQSEIKLTLHIPSKDIPRGLYDVPVQLKGMLVCQQNIFFNFGEFCIELI